MVILLFLIPISLIVASLAIYGIFWSIKNRQYDDLDGDANRFLNDDDKIDKK